MWEQLGILQEKNLEGMQGFEEICTILLIRGQGVEHSCCLFSHTWGNAAGTWVSLPVSRQTGKTFLMHFLVCGANIIISRQSQDTKKPQNKNNKLFCNWTNRLGVKYFCRRLIYEKHLLSQRRACVFKEGINLASYTFACFLAPKPDL